MSISKVNGGWGAALAGWIISSILFPFLPEIMKAVIDNTPIDLFGFPLMEYVATIGFWSLIFLIVWIPAGFKASKVYKEKGIKSARIFAAIVFIFLLVFLCIVFRFFWNS